MLYDSLLLIACFMLIGGLYVSFVAGILKVEPESLSPTLLQLTLFPLLFITATAFFSFFWRKSGRTLGMQTWRLQVISTREEADLPNRRLTQSQCLLRLLCALLSLLSCGLGFLWALLSHDRLTWHDLLSHSQVVYLPKEKRKH